MYVGHALGLKSALTVAENLRFWAEALGATPDRVARAMDSFALGPLANLAVGRLSAGQQRRASLARLGLVDASLWLLDEPTVSLDAATVDRLTAVMGDHRRRGGMIIAATHQDVGLADAQTLTLTPVTPWQDAAG
jgi:heme exporter protein A